MKTILIFLVLIFSGVITLQAQEGTIDELMLQNGGKVTHFYFPDVDSLDLDSSYAADASLFQMSPDTNFTSAPYTFFKWRATGTRDSVRVILVGKAWGINTTWEDAWSIIDTIGLTSTKGSTSWTLGQISAS